MDNDSAFCRIMGKLPLFTASYQLLLVLLNGHLVCCKSWKHIVELPGMKTVSAICHCYVFEGAYSNMINTEKVIDGFELRKPHSKFLFESLFIYFASWEKLLMKFFVQCYQGRKGGLLWPITLKHISINK